MSSWKFSARTNFVRVLDPDGLKRALSPFDVALRAHATEPGYYALFPQTDDGDFPAFQINDDGEELEFHIYDLMPFIADGEVLVVMSVGSENNRRYLSADAQAYQRIGDQVQMVRVDIDDIYARAAETFQVKVEQIAPCTYETLSKQATLASRAKNQERQR